jgi:predicted glycosyltransferase involved in capsule biosynthesis
MDCDAIRWNHYVYVEQDEFNSGQLINEAAKFNGLTNDLLMICDTDLIYPPHYLNTVLATPDRMLPCVGWSVMRYLSKVQTVRYLDGKGLDSIISYSIQSHPANACGGVIAIPRAVWNEIGGMSEDFVGWGGRDNELWSKLAAYGYEFKRLDMALWHLFHEHAGKEGDGNWEKVVERRGWKKEDWKRWMKDSKS